MGTGVTVGLLVVGTRVGTGLMVGSGDGSVEIVGSSVGEGVGYMVTDGAGVVGRGDGATVDEVGAMVGEQSDVVEPAPPVAQVDPSDDSRVQEISEG